VQLVEHEVLTDPDVAHISLLELEERSAHGGPAIAVLRWPDHRDRIDESRRAGEPRLLVLRPSDEPLVVADDVEDWLRLPVDDGDVRMRLLRLRDRATRLPRCPVLDGYSRLLFAGSWVGLSTIEERLARPLVDRFERVVSYRELLEAGWPGQHKDKIILRPRITGLRRRVATIGLELRSIRDVGHLLEAS
jgi:hypothetical protein